MKLTVILEDPIHSYPLNAVLVVKPILNEELDTIYFNLYENETSYQQYLSGSFDSTFNVIRSNSERVGESLRSRIIGELSTGSTSVFTQLMPILYTELITLPKYSSTYWLYDNIVN